MLLADTLYRVSRERGLHIIQRRGPRQAQWLTSRRLILEPEERASHRSADEETVVVLQEGSGTLEAGGRRDEVSRKSVFAEPATALYVPPGMDLAVVAKTRLEAILVSAPSSRTNGAPALVGPRQVKINPRGRADYAREVHDLFVDDEFAERLMVGETFNPAGHWSSYPPHKHDGRDGEPTLEEIYHYRVDPPQGFGQQMLYTRDGECVTHAVKDGDAVLLPYGYHPVSSPPGYRLYYLWGMAGAIRKLALHEDPDHRWIHDAANA